MIHEEVVTGRLIDHAHEVIGAAVTEGDVVVDATLGNGYDTLFLARCAGKTGKVIGFDVQQMALDATRRRLLDHVDNGVALSSFQLCLESHDQISCRVKSGEAAAMMFNLGYLPGADKSLITETETTLAALAQAMICLRPGGVLTVMCYPGHDGGDTEAQKVVLWAGGLGGVAESVSLIRQETSRALSPFLIVVTKSW